MYRLLHAIRAGVAALALAAAGASLASSPPLDEAIAPLASAYMAAVEPGEAADLHRDLFHAVLQRVERNYAREVNIAELAAAASKTLEAVPPNSGEPAEVFRKAINAALATLDPHSRYLDPRAQMRQRSTVTGTFGGLGLQVDMVEGLVRIVAPMPGTPAERAGLRSGDLIVRFDDQPVQGMALTDAVSRMRGEPGTPIELVIRRAGRGDEFSVSLVREIIRTQSLRWSVEGDVLVLRLRSFTASSTAAVQTAIAEASAQREIRGVVLDMRGNGGGLFRQAVTLADTFLGAGEIVSIRGRGGRERTWGADPVELLPGIPMVVLLDGRSASAAELLAAALQENGRAIVMGQRSFGKGSVQSIVSLGAGKGALRLTTALYHGPSGRSVQRTGVGPDVELLGSGGSETRPRRREADRNHALPGSDEPPPPKARVEEARCAAIARDDPALACALTYLGSGGIDAFIAALEATEAISSR